MGKARILSAQGDGLYSIEILEDRTRAESLRVMAQQRIAEIDAELADLEQELDDAQQAVDDAAEAQDQAIDQHQAEIIAAGESNVDLQAYAQAVLDAAAARDAIRTRIGSLNIERLSRQGWVDRVDALPPLRTQAAWCADYTEDLSGEVATAEVPGEIGKVIIKPGFEDAAAWNPSADGAIQPALAGTPASVFYNLAMMPGWQRWRPTFRVATISNISEDLCDITLDAAASSHQGLNVNAQGSYSGVPIYYMECNGGAFENGDRVLVAFSGNTEQPMVVGFEQNPRVCSGGIFHMAPMDEFPPHSQTIPYSSKYASIKLETYGTGVAGCFANEPGDMEVVDRTHEATRAWRTFSNPDLSRYVSYAATHDAESEWSTQSSIGSAAVNSAAFSFASERISNAAFADDATGWFTSGLNSGTTSCPAGPGIDASISLSASTTAEISFSSNATTHDGLQIHWERVFSETTQATAVDEVEGDRSGPTGRTIVALSSLTVGTINRKVPVITASSVNETLSLCGVTLDIPQVCAFLGVDNTLFPGSETDAWRSASYEYGLGGFAPEAVLETQGKSALLSLAVCFRRRTGGLKGFVVSVEKPSGSEEWQRAATPFSHRSTLASQSKIGFTLSSLTPIPEDVG